ncbi:MAG: uroporphyrinogen decarboxylase [Alphaproteobacteria bacterium]|nr:uroporphyrinogen decarboxylase [Alphaproteobacteria bacterium]
MIIEERKVFLSTLKKNQAGGSHAFWFMRQAGRYLPEYRELRSKAKDFLDFCYTPEMAVEATLQPIRRFGMSAAIIFSDILVLPHALGMKVWFEAGHGPKLVPLKTIADVENLSLNAIEDFLSPVYQAITQTKKSLPEGVALIGFCGAPWTLACYAVEGSGSRDYQSVRSAALRDPAFFTKLIDVLTDAVIIHADLQIKAGAETIQIFDSWSSVLTADEFSAYSIEPAKKIVSALKKKHPHVPVIGFPRLAGVRYGDYAKITGVDAVSVDASVPLDYIKNNIQPLVTVQGNLDNVLLAEDKFFALDQAKRILETLGEKPFIFNLGHGVLPHTPVENVEALSDLIRNWK